MSPRLGYGLPQALTAEADRWQTWATTVISDRAGAPGQGGWEAARPGWSERAGVPELTGESGVGLPRSSGGSAKAQGQDRSTAGVAGGPLCWRVLQMQIQTPLSLK